MCSRKRPSHADDLCNDQDDGEKMSEYMPSETEEAEALSSDWEPTARPCKRRACRTTAAGSVFCWSTRTNLGCLLDCWSVSQQDWILAVMQ